MDNITQQADEIEALAAIYEDKWIFDENTGSYSIRISPDVELYVTLNADYPSKSAPIYELLAPCLNAPQKQNIHHEFETIFKNNSGSPILFQWIEKLKEVVVEGVVVKQVDREEVETIEYEKTSEKRQPEKLIKVTHGPIIEDRKSVFQGHVSCVYDTQDVKDVMGYLLEIKKFAQATHNITAYRIETSNQILLQDCDDDGELHASSRLLHLLEILNLKNVMVIVSRWYGGIHLGPDRFKHINNAARQVLQEAGFIR